jgi:hypothetical protein
MDEFIGKSPRFEQKVRRYMCVAGGWQGRTAAPLAHLSET